MWFPLCSNVSDFIAFEVCGLIKNKKINSLYTETYYIPKIVF